MNVWNGKAAEVMRPVANLFILNTLWIIACLPLLTVGPATAAALAVLREWKISGNDSAARSFFRFFRLYFKPAFIAGTGWLAAGIILTADLFFVFYLPDGWNLFLTALVGTVCFLWLLAGTTLLPCMVHYQKTGLALWKQSFVLAFLDLQTSCAILLFWVAGGLLFWISPVLLLCSFTLLSYATIQFSLRSFERLEKKGVVNFIPSYDLT